MKNVIIFGTLVILAASMATGCKSEPEIPAGQSIEHPLGANGGPSGPAKAAPVVTTPSKPIDNPQDAAKLVNEAMKKSGK
jgi:hypothetical protein